MFKGDKNKFGAQQLAAMEKEKSNSHIRMPDEINDNLDRDKPSSAAKLYDTYCRMCHQQNGKGDGARFPPLDSSEWVIGDKKRLINLVLNGVQGPIDVKGKSYNGTMPMHAFLSDNDLAVVLTYVRRSFGNAADSVNAAEVGMLRSKNQDTRSK